MLSWNRQISPWRARLSEKSLPSGKMPRRFARRNRLSNRCRSDWQRYPHNDGEAYNSLAITVDLVTSWRSPVGIHVPLGSSVYKHTWTKSGHQESWETGRERRSKRVNKDSDGYLFIDHDTENGHGEVPPSSSDGASGALEGLFGLKTIIYLAFDRFRRKCTNSVYGAMYM